MCGIAGVFRPGGARPEDTLLVQSMNDAQAHRGPDAQGVLESGACVLGHRRLAIIDLSDDGRQPFVSQCGRYAMVFNGEIYNYIELRQELAGKGYVFHTRTDTEVLLAAYREWGAGGLQRLNGMFAFAVYDAKEQSLFLARDRFGVKPLYYAQVGGALVFSSEIKAVLQTPGLSRQVDELSVFDYLAFNRTDVYDRTFFAEVKRLPKGTYAVTRGTEVEPVPWWRPEDFLGCREGAPDKVACAHIEELLVDAVRLRLRSDVAVGSCLSGGLDSSILLGILFDRQGARPGYPCFTAVFPGHGIDESGYVDQLLSRFPFVSHRTNPTWQGAAQNLDAFVLANDEPTTAASFYAQYEVMRLARKKGVVVLLDGQGGDESFAGYQYFHGFYWYGLLRRGRLGSLGAELACALARRQHVSAWHTLAYQLLPDAVRVGLLARTLPFMRREFFDRQVGRSLIHTEFFQAKGLGHSLALHFRYKLEHLLRMEDRNSMAFAIEARLPYLDYRLVEYVLGLSDQAKISAGETKALQKRALGGYTLDSIRNRKDKLGFETPTGDWMGRGPWPGLAKDALATLKRELPQVVGQDATLPGSGAVRWKLIQLAAWLRLFCGRGGAKAA